MTATAPANLDPRIAAFAAAVRAELADLPVDDVDDLIDGLEGDLADQAADSAEAFVIPDAAAYAAELRSAAGLPERRPTAPRRTAVIDQARASVRAWVDRIRSHPTGAALISFFIALRPVWWILRGWALFAIIGGLTTGALFNLGLPDGAVGWILLLALVVLSVQWGRGRWAPRRWLQVTRTLVSVIAAIALPFLVAVTISGLQSLVGYYYSGDAGAVPYTPGLAVDGERVRNIFAYDAAGNPLPQVQLFDQDGRPLTTVGRDGANGVYDGYFFCGGGPVPVALTAPGRAPLWNVFPLAEVPADGAAACGADSEQAVDSTVPAFPFPQVPVAQVPGGGMEAMPTPMPSGSGPSPAPSNAAPTPAPTVGLPAPQPTASTDGGASAGPTPTASPVP